VIAYLNFSCDQNVIKVSFSLCLHPTRYFDHLKGK